MSHFLINLVKDYIMEISHSQQKYTEMHRIPNLLNLQELFH
jgi:hypothetical protein